MRQEEARHKCAALDCGASVASKLSVDFCHKTPTVKFIIQELLKTTSSTNKLVL